MLNTMLTETDFARLQQRLGISFQNLSLLKEALTHSSYVNENPHVASNERLEFLGDAVLGLLLAEKLFQDYPDSEEGDLTRMRSQLVRRIALADIARALGLGEYLYLGRGEAASGGRDKTANVAGALEAVCAAIYLDHDWQATRECIIHLFDSELIRIRHEHFSDDYKSRFQELAQLRFKQTPSVPHYL
jgi:ribonuclease-3